MQLLKRDPARFDLTTKDAKDWISATIASIEGTRPNQWRPSIVAEMVLITGTKLTVKQIDILVKWVDDWVNTDLELIRTTGRSKISFDSYLQASMPVNDIAYTLAAFDEHVPAHIRAKWLAHARQIVWNIHNFTKAFWGNNPEGSAKHPGWGISLPGNNYFFVFLSATQNFALVSGDEWATERMYAMWIAVRNYWKNLPEGGSLEGTGYGRAGASLMDSYADFKDTTGNVYPELETYANGNVHYLIHATMPGGEYIAAIGDQSNQASHQYAEQDRSFMLNTLRVATDPTAKALGQWYLQNTKVKKITSWYLKGAELIKHTETPMVPTELSYWAKGAGHTFMRSSWDADAVHVGHMAGPNEENHDHHDQGSLTLWVAGQPILSPQSMWSQSGLLQNPRHQNGFVFQQSGVWLAQVRTKAGQVFPDVDLDSRTIMVDLTPSIPVIAGATHNQSVRIEGDEILQVDEANFSKVTKAYWVRNTRIKPVISAIPGGDSMITLGSVVVWVVGGGTAEVVDWKALDAKTYPNGGYQILIPVTSGVPITTKIVLPKAFPIPNTDPNEEDPVEIENLKREVAELKEIVNDLRTQTEQLQNTVQDKQASVDRLTEENRLASENLTKQQIAIDELTTTKENQVKVIEELNARIKVLEDEANNTEFEFIPLSELVFARKK